MACFECKRDVPIENKDTGLCASCNKSQREDKALWPIARLDFLRIMVKHDEKCPVYGVPITLESDVHHKKGRTGYADDWARENGISLLIDPRFFLACCRAGHQYIEDPANREEAILKGWIVSREQR